MHSRPSRSARPLRSTAQAPVAAGSTAAAAPAARGSLLRRAATASWRPVLFAVLLWAATAAGAVPVPGVPTPITLQTFVVMMAGMMMPWRQASASIALYLAAGAAGLPVFAGGASTMALVGPDAGFLLGFLPGVAVIALLRSHRNTAGVAATVLAGARNLAAALIGGVAVVYAVGFGMQAVMLHMPLLTVAAASAAFIVGDVVKAVIAATTATALARLR